MKAYKIIFKSDINYNYFGQVFSGINGDKIRCYATLDSALDTLDYSGDSEEFDDNNFEHREIFEVEIENPDSSDCGGDEVLTKSIKFIRKLSIDDIIREITSSSLAYNCIINYHYFKQNLKMDMDRDEFRKILIDKITDSREAYFLGFICPEDREIMIDRVTDSYWAYNWAKMIGNKDIMIERITSPKDIEEFNKFCSKEEYLLDSMGT